MVSVQNEKRPRPRWGATCTTEKKRLSAQLSDSAASLSLSEPWRLRSEIMRAFSLARGLAVRIASHALPCGPSNGQPCLSSNGADGRACQPGKGWRGGLAWADGASMAGRLEALV